MKLCCRRDRFHSLMSAAKEGSKLGLDADGIKQ